MKHFFLILFLSLSVPLLSLAQTGFPVKVDATYFNGMKDSFNATSLLKDGGYVFDLNRRIREEGQPFYVTISANNQTFGTGVTMKNISGGAVVYPGWVFIPKAYNLEATRPLALYMQIGSGAPTGYFPYQVATISKNQFAGDLFPVTEGSSINTIAERFDSADGDTPFFVRGSVVGTLIYKGYNKKSDINILLEGDSIFQSAAFVSGDDSKLFQGIIREYYCSIGINGQSGKIARVINKAKGSGNSTNWLSILNSGDLDISEFVDMRICMYGTNDVIQGYQANGNALTQPQIDAIIAAYSANLTARIQNHIKRYGNKTKLIIVGATPIYNTVEESALVQLRNAAKGIVQSIGGAVWNGGTSPVAAPENNIWFTSFGATNTQAGVFTANSYSSYIETTGNAVHPNSVSSLAMGNWLTNMFAVNNITLR